MISLLLYCVIFLNIRFSFLFFILFICFRIIFFTLQRTQCWKITQINPLKMYQLQYISPKNTSSIVRRKRPSPQHLSKLVNKNTFLNLNTASYFINILASPDVSTCSTTGGPINKTIKNLGLTRHHRKTAEITWHMVNNCK